MMPHLRVVSTPAMDTMQTRSKEHMDLYESHVQPQRPLELGFDLDLLSIHNAWLDPALQVPLPWSPLDPYPTHNAMPSEQTRPPPSAASSSKKPLQPPRPPNAWILYRADKVKELQSSDPNAPRAPQSDISKQISAMWKSEHPHVKEDYERRADLKKAEHQAMYPNYRFQPMKRADKERIREEKKQEKDRDRDRDSKRTPAQPYTAKPIAAYPFPLYAHPAHVAAQASRPAQPTPQATPAPLLSASPESPIAPPSVKPAPEPPTTVSSSVAKVITPTVVSLPSFSATSLPSPDTPDTPESSLPPEPPSTVSPPPDFPFLSNGETKYVQLSNKWGPVGPTPPMSAAASPVIAPRMFLPTEDDLRSLQTILTREAEACSTVSTPENTGNSDDTESDSPSPLRSPVYGRPGVLAASDSLTTVVSDAPPPPLSEANTVVWDPKDVEAMNANFSTWNEGGIPDIQDARDFSADGFPNSFMIPGTNWHGWSGDDSHFPFSSNSLLPPPPPQVPAPVQAYMSSTQEPGVFSLTGFDPSILLGNPPGDIEVNIDHRPGGNVRMTDRHFNDIANEIFANWDFLSGQESTQSLPPTGNEASSVTIDPSALVRPKSPTDIERDSFLFQLLNNASQQFDQEHYENSVETAPSQPSTVNSPIDAPQQTTSHYRPPGGAVRTAVRRAGGTWKAPGARS